MSLSTLGKIGMADKLSVAQLQQAVKAGSIPAYIGIPLIQEKVKEEQDAKAALAAQNTPQNSVAEQVMAQATQQEMSGLGDLPTNLPEQYANGGIIGYADGGDITQEEYDEQLEDAEFDAFARAMINRTPNVEKGLRNAPSMSYSQVQGQAPRNAPAKEVPTSNHKYADTVLKYAEQYGVDPKLALHVLNKETGGMKNPETARSKAGALGIMQLMPATAKMLGVKDPLDPEQSAEGGVRYLSMLGPQFKNDPRLTAAAYNAGPGNVRKYGDVPPFAETQGYVKGLAEGGIASVPRFGGQDESLVEDDNRTRWDMITDWLGKRDPNSMFAGTSERFQKNAESGGPLATGSAIHNYFMAKPNRGEGTLKGLTDQELAQLEAEGRENATYNWPSRSIGSYQGYPTAAEAVAARDKNLPPKAVAPVADEGKGTEKPAGDGKPTTTEKPSPWQELRDQISQSQERRKQQKEQDMWLAIMAGGLGTMAGTSQYAGVNLGQGALHGLQQYGTSRREAGKEEAADLKTLANIARYEGMDKYYADQAEANAAKGKDYVEIKNKEIAANALARKDADIIREAKARYGDKIELMSPADQAAFNKFIETQKATPGYMELQNTLYGDLNKFKVLR